MRILMVTDFYWPFNGGVEQHVRSLSNALAARGHTVAVATLQQDQLPAFELDGAVRVHRVRGTAERASFLFSNAGRPWAPPIADPELLLGLREVITQEQPDVLHGHDWLARSVLPLKGFAHAPLVMSLHYYTLSCAKKNMMFHGAPCSGPGLRKCLSCASNHYGAAKGVPVTIGNWAMGAMERAAVDMFLPVSHATAAGNGLPGSRLPFKVLPNFVADDIGEARDEPAEYIAQLPSEPFLLFVGDLRPMKGLDVLLAAYAGLDHAPPLVLIGKVWEETPAEFPAGVTVLKNWPNNAVMAAWRRSMAAVVPSVWAEPFGIVVIEAMACGKPVIGSRIGGIPDLVDDGETGLLVPAGDADALRAAIARLAADPALRDRMGQAALHKVTAFQVSTVVPQIEQVYRELTQQRATGMASAFAPAPALAEQPTPLVSIIINNYNYGRFLHEAIDSALGQSYPRIETIVVDDGSTDHSQAVITRYGARVLPVLKANGGQASCFNAGFARSQGEIVLFLDADDRLHPHVVAELVAAFQVQPSAAKAQFRLALIDADGRPTGATKPERGLALPQGDMRRQARAFPDDIRWQPTSGNAFAAHVLRRILPMPEPEYRICADYYLSNLPPLFGEVLALDAAGADYRVHGLNNHHSATLNLEQTRQLITRTCETHAHMQRFAKQLGLAGFASDPTQVLSITFLAHRMTSLKLNRHRHPIAGDRLARLLPMSISAALGRFDLPVWARLVYMLWFIALALAPQPLAHWLTRQFFFPDVGRRFSQAAQLIRQMVARSNAGAQPPSIEEPSELFLDKA